MEIREQVILAPFTTFGIGGPARYFVEVRTETEVREALLFAQEKCLKTAILGGGSNVLVSDKGFDGVIIKIMPDDLLFDGDLVRVSAGYNLLTLIRTCTARGLGGWESLAGIPGTVGGAVRGNAGAFGSEIRDFVLSVRALHRETLEAREFSNKESNFAYRDSYYKEHSEWIITAVSLRLTHIEVKESRRLIDETIAVREKRHLQNVRAAGSFFMNPVAPQDVIELFEREKGGPARLGRVPAGWLIEKVGMKGVRVGGAIASEMHPNYILNETGDARAEDVLTLAEKICERVEQRFGICLKKEAAVLE